MNSMGFATEEQVTPSWSCSWSWSWAYRWIAARSLLVSCRYSKGTGGEGRERHCIFPAAIVFLIKRCHMLRVSLLSQCLIADNALAEAEAEAERSHHKASQAKLHVCCRSPCTHSFVPLFDLLPLGTFIIWDLTKRTAAFQLTRGLARTKDKQIQRYRCRQLQIQSGVRLCVCVCM